MWGVRLAVGGGNHNYSGRKSDRVRLLRNLEMFDLKDLHARAKSAYLSRVSSIHPDRGGDTELAVALNCAWDNTEALFRKRGLEI